MSPAVSVLPSLSWITTPGGSVRSVCNCCGPCHCICAGALVRDRFKSIARSERDCCESDFRASVVRPNSAAVTLRPEPEGGFTVRVPALPEIVSYGEDEQQALAKAKDAIGLSLGHPLAAGQDTPPDEPRVGG